MPYPWWTSRMTSNSFWHVTRGQEIRLDMFYVIFFRFCHRYIAVTTFIIVKFSKYGIFQKRICGVKYYSERIVSPCNKTLKIFLIVVVSSEWVVLPILCSEMFFMSSLSVCFYENVNKNHRQEIQWNCWSEWAVRDSVSPGVIQNCPVMSPTFSVL